ncbi:MAG: hypothetical protein WCF47_10775, partial [Pseudolabrys sp.]
MSTPALIRSCIFLRTILGLCSCFKFYQPGDTSIPAKDATMIKDILVTLPVGGLSDGAVNYAV